MKRIALGAGCFWGVEAAFKLLPGIIKTRVGYMGGHLESPTYEEVCQKTTGHAEVVWLEYDESEVSLKKILDLFFFIHNPYQVGGQGNDIGPQYRSEVFTDEEKFVAEYISKMDRPSEIQTQVSSLVTFYDAEEYHQEYLLKNPLGYCHVNMNDVRKFIQEM